MIEFLDRDFVGNAKRSRPKLNSPIALCRLRCMSSIRIAHAAYDPLCGLTESSLSAMVERFT